MQYPQQRQFAYQQQRDSVGFASMNPQEMMAVQDEDQKGSHPTFDYNLDIGLYTLYDNLM